MADRLRTVLRRDPTKSFSSCEKNSGGATWNIGSRFKCAAGTHSQDGRERLDSTTTAASAFPRNSRALCLKSSTSGFRTTT